MSNDGTETTTQNTGETGNLTANEVRRIQIYTAAHLFVAGMTRTESLANRIGVTTDYLTALIDTPEWQQALAYWGAKAKNPSARPRPPDNTPHTLRERYLLLNAFPKEESPIRFVTYDGILDATIKEFRDYELVLEDDTVVKKLSILLAFPRHKMPAVKLGVKRRQGVASMNLRPIKRRQDRPKVEIKASPGDRVEAVMRNGLVVTGQVIWNGRYNLVMRVGEGLTGGKVVIVYRHGIYAFSVVKSRNYPDVEYDDEWQDEVRVISVESEDEADGSAYIVE